PGVVSWGGAATRAFRARVTFRETGGSTRSRSSTGPACGARVRDSRGRRRTRRGGGDRLLPLGLTLRPRDARAPGGRLQSAELPRLLARVVAPHGAAARAIAPLRLRRRRARPPRRTSRRACG